MRAAASLAFLAAAVAPALAQSDPNLATIPNDDPAMARAVAKARAGLPTFIAESQHPKPGEETFGVKVGLGPAGSQEFFWVTPFRVEGTTLSGELDNEPETIQGYHKGQTVKVPLTEVTDWMYIDHGKMRGNLTACVLLARQGAEALKAFEKDYGADCSSM